MGNQDAANSSQQTGAGASGSAPGPQTHLPEIPDQIIGGNRQPAIGNHIYFENAFGYHPIPRDQKVGTQMHTQMMWKLSSCYTGQGQPKLRNNKKNHIGLLFRNEKLLNN